MVKTGRACKDVREKHREGLMVRVRVRGSKHGRVCEGEGAREQTREGV